MGTLATLQSRRRFSIRTGPPTRTESIELAPRSDGARYRRVTLSVEPDGEVVLRSHEMGASDEAAWGLDDDEVTLSVPPDQVARLALALAAELLKGGAGAVARLSDICEAYDVSCRVGCWT
jgi:hypothetical protein